MSVFERLRYRQRTRKFLFWGVCIWARICLAIAVFFACYHGPTRLQVTSGIVLTAVACGFGVQLKIDNKPNIWWKRDWHCALYLFGGVFAFLASFEKSNPPNSKSNDWAFGTLAFLLVDVGLGICTAFNHPWIAGASGALEPELTASLQVPNV